MEPSENNKGVANLADQKKHPQLQVHSILPRSMLTNEDNYLYYEEMKRLHFTSYMIHQQVKEQLALKKEADQKLDFILRKVNTTKRQLQESVNHSPSEGKTKRTRRTNSEIEKKFPCEYEKCGKAYASFNSLLQHLRLKHDQMDIIDSEHGKSGKAYVSFGSLVQHLRVKHDQIPIQRVIHSEKKEQQQNVDNEGLLK